VFLGFSQWLLLDITESGDIFGEARRKFERIEANCRCMKNVAWFGRLGVAMGGDAARMSASHECVRHISTTKPVFCSSFLLFYQ